MATLRGEPVDRPAVSFYEVEGVRTHPTKRAHDPFDIYHHPSWRPLIDLAVERTDRMAMLSPRVVYDAPSPWEERTEVETRIDENGARWVTRTTTLDGGRVLTRRTRQDPDVATVWTLEHPLRDADDLRAWLELPERELKGRVDAEEYLAEEAGLGESGIMMGSLSDPICSLAAMFEFGAFTMVALMEPDLMDRALARIARERLWETERIAEALPGRMWRLVGPEYATAPYLPADMFQRYVVGYDRQMVNAIQSGGGFVRLHCHGRIRDVLEHIVATGASGLDPVEPAPQGDVSLAWVKERVGDRMALFGNLEASDLENLPVAEFEKKIETALREGTAGESRGFVLMPSASPYGRVLSDTALRNYERMVEMTENWQG